MYQCNAQGVIASMESCAALQNCQMGLTGRKCLVCIPGTHKCTGTALERCNTEGTGYMPAKTCATAALCNASVGDCTAMACAPNGHTCQGDMLRRCNAAQTGYEDVKMCRTGLCDAMSGQCDECAAGSKTCELDTVVSCSTDGQTVTRTACAGATPQCVGLGRCAQCSGDADCPDPGACKTRHCNLATGMCEPQNQASRTACTGGLCDGAGSCRGCLQNTDCPDPGECKARYCNPTTRTCAPTNVSSGTSCGTGGYCNGSGSCAGCTMDAHCTAPLCNSARCSVGQCVFTPLSAGTRDTRCPSSQVCSAGECVPCTSATHCPQPRADQPCLVAACTSNRCSLENKTGSCGQLLMCVNGVCTNSCGNARLDTAAGEECDVNANGHDSWSCNRQTCRRTGLSGSTLSAQCSSNSQCSTSGGEVCDQTGWFGFPMCLPSCSSGACSLPPGWTALPCGGASSTTGCLVHCTANGSCPTGTSCSTSDSAGICL